MASTVTNDTAINPVGQTATQDEQVDLAPLWTGYEERIFQAEVLRKRPDRVEGWSPVEVIRSWFFGVPLLTGVVRALHVVAFVSFILLVRDLAELSTWGNLWETFRYSAWTTLLLFVLTFATRRLSALKLIRYWAMGTMLTPLLVYYLYGPLNSLITTDHPNVWLVPILEEVMKVSPVIVILLFHRRLRFQYGMSDFLIIGFILGAGFAFTEDGMWGRSIGMGFDGFWGWLVPDSFTNSGALVAGHGVWTALTSVGLALIVLHRRKATMIVVGAVMVLAPVFDHMVANDFDTVAPWVKYQFIGTHSLAVLFLGAIALALAMDFHTLVSMTPHDHLLVSPWHYFRNSNSATPGVVSSNRLLTLRYLRYRNGLYYHKAYEDDPWPSSRQKNYLSALRSTANAGRGAGALTGALPADRGWGVDPVNPARERWYNARGWTSYTTEVVNNEVVASVTEAPGRPFALRQPAAIVSATWGRNLLIAAGIAAAYAIYRIATGSEPEPTFMFAPPEGSVGSYYGRVPGSELVWGSLPASGNPVPGPAGPGGPSSGTPPPPPDSGPPPPPPDSNNPPSDSGPDSGPPDSGPPDDGPPDDGPPDDEPPEDCP